MNVSDVGGSAGLVWNESEVLFLVFLLPVMVVKGSSLHLGNYFKSKRALVTIHPP